MDSRTPKKDEARIEAQKMTLGVALGMTAVVWMGAALVSVFAGFAVHSVWAAAQAGWILFDMLLGWNS